MSHGINANQLHNWRRLFGRELPAVAVSTPALIRITVVPNEPVTTRSDDSPSPSGRIDIELGRARVSLSGRVDLDVLHTLLATLRP